MPSPQYFFGIGAQKAGTTWLHDVLDSYSDCAVPAIKELHFFDIRWRFDGDASTDSIYLARLKMFERLSAGLMDDIKDYHHRAQIRTNVKKGKTTTEAGKPPLPGIFQDGYLGKVNVEGRLKQIRLLAGYLGIRNITDYAAFIEEFRLQKNARVAGEITPSYALLPADAFKEMDSRFPGCRFIFIMRDPLGRFLSQLRFKKKRHASKGDADFDPAAYFDSALSDPNFLLRSDYRRTIDTLESVIPADRILYLFFEEMVAPATAVENLRQVETLLGLAPRPDAELLAFCEQKKNVSEAVEFSADQLSRGHKALAHVYDYVESRFGRRPAGWKYP